MKDVEQAHRDTSSESEYPTATLATEFRNANVECEQRGLPHFYL
jgi:hypothetical protein